MRFRRMRFRRVAKFSLRIDNHPSRPSECRRYPTESDSLNTDLDRFVAEFRDVNFRHFDELMSGIENGTVSLHSVNEDSTQAIEELIRTFEIRLRILDRQLATEQCVRKRLVRADTALLCDGLRAHRDDLCDFWSFSSESGGTLFVYVARRARMIMGCVGRVVPGTSGPTIPEAG